MAVVGMTLAAAAILGTAYFSYRALVANAQAETAAAMNGQLTVNAPVHCMTNELTDMMWSSIFN
jgi:hypothetical protein